MTLKKLIAAVLTSAMMAAFVPQMAMAGTETVLFNYTFDSSSTVPSGLQSATTSAWSSEWEDGKMTYSITNANKSFSQLFEFIPNISLEREKWYEYGYTYSVSGTGTIPRFYQNAVIGNGGGSVVDIVSLSLDDYSKIDGDIKITSYFKLSNKYYSETAKRDMLTVTREVKAEYTINGDPVVKTKTTTFENWNIRDSFYRIVFNGDPANGTLKITLDDMYLREADAYTVSFDANGGVASQSSVAILGKEYNVSLPTATKSDANYDYDFLGWYKDNETFEEEFDPETEVLSEDITLYAKWLKKYKIIYDTGDADLDLDVGIAFENEGITELPALSELIWTGYQFNFWYVDENDNDVYDEGVDTIFDGTGVTDNMTVKADWIVAHEIIFYAPDADSNDDKIIKRYGVTGLKEAEIPVPVREGYRFDGWFYGDDLETEFTAETEITGPMSAEAKWTKQYKITYEVNGGEVVSPGYTLGEAVEAPTPVKTGYTFDGWYWDKEFTIPFDGTGVTEDTTIYAKWDNVILKIDFESEEDAALGEQMMQQLAPSKSIREGLIAEGYGVVDDGMDTGNKAFRLAYETNGNAATISFPQDVGKGFFEITYKLKCDTQSLYVTDIMTPTYGGFASTNKIVNTRIDLDNYITFGSAQASPSKMSEMGDYMEVTYWLDTTNNQSSIMAKVTDIYGGTYTGSSYNASFSSEKAGFDGLIIVAASNTDSSNGVRFGNYAYANMYIDDIVVKKIDLPTVTSITPADEEMYVSTKPEIEIEFSTKMDRNTVSSDTIYLQDASGNKPAQMVLIETVDDRSVATIKLSEELEYDSEYTIVVNGSITDGTYFMDKTHEYTFKTRAEKLSATATVTYKDSGENVTKMSQAKGKTVVAALSVDNIMGTDDETMFVTAVLVDTATEKQLACAIDTATVEKGVAAEVLNAEFTIPDDATDNYKIWFHVWDSATGRTAKYDVVQLP